MAPPRQEPARRASEWLPGRVDLVVCLVLQLSIAFNSFGSIRRWIEMAPVFGRPRPRFFSVRDIDLDINFAYQKIRRPRKVLETPYAA